MKTTSIQHIAIAVLAFVFTAGSINAAALNIPDCRSGTEGTVLKGFEGSSGTTGTIYIKGSITYHAVDPHVTSTAYDFIAFTSSTLSQGERIWLGFTTNYVANGEVQMRSGGTDTSTLTTTPTAGTTINYIFKINQEATTDNITFWLNPTYNIGDDESVLGPGVTMSHSNAKNLNRIRLWYNDTDASGYTGDTEYHSMRLYTDGWSPIPEPETYALIFGGLVFGFVMLRHRFMA